MLTFVVRRVLASIFVLLGASFLMYNLAANAGDPLGEIKASGSPNKAALLESRIRLLDLNTPPPVRFFKWLGGVVTGDWGPNIEARDTGALLGKAIGSTLELVTAATILAIVIGIAIGIISALRQYSGFDYSVTFMSFLFFSLPIFWVAVLLKQFGAIKFNDFLRDPSIGIGLTIVLALLSGLIWSVIIGGDRQRRLTVFGAAAAAAAAVVAYISATTWFEDPSLGFIGVALISAGIAFGVTELITGIKNRKVLTGALITAGVGVVLYFPLQPLLDRATFLMIFLLALAALIVGAVVGYLTGGYDRAQSVRTSAIVGFLCGGVVLMDRFMQSWSDYVGDRAIRGRPIATVGSRTPNLDGDFWIEGIDMMTHLILPTVAIILISLATHSRYARASMLEVMNQDYVRTARAKGLTERTVVMRHAFRNALIPIATIVAFDFGGILGGAVVTESVFARPGMGKLFVDAMKPDRLDLNPAMAFFVVVGATAVLFNMLADLSYAALDPRIRVG